VVYSEADGLPGLIIDRFGDVCVVQSLTAGMENLLELVLDGLHELLAPKVIVLASDAPIRTLEGLELVRKVVHGRLDGYVEFEEDGIRLLADPVNGQKTGFFLDQRNNRRLIAEFVRPGDRAIDLFCYSGAFGLALLQRGAAHVTFMDSSESALALAREAVSRNEWLDRAEFVRADIFPYLKEPHEPYDIVVMDPPSLAKSRTKVPSALRAYRDLNARAISLVRPGGILATASCSGLVERVRWLKALTEAGLKAGRTLRRLAEGGQPPDHPVLSAMPETEYLKFAVFVVD
jgi:23S rRNA (cytosine1962-C5)-methyltransferase